MTAENDRESDSPDRMLQALAAAPRDDEPSSAAEDASEREALAAYHRGEAVSADELRWELDILPRQGLRRLTPAEFDDFMREHGSHMLPPDDEG